MVCMANESKLIEIVINCDMFFTEDSFEKTFTFNDKAEMMKLFPEQKSGVYYITEGGTETEIMYKFGHELPHFAMYPLLDNPKATQDLELMFQKYLDTVAQSGLSALMGALITGQALIGLND